MHPSDSQPGDLPDNYARPSPWPLLALLTIAAAIITITITL